VLGVGGGGKGFRYRTFSFYSNKIIRFWRREKQGYSQELLKYLDTNFSCKAMEKSNYARNHYGCEYHHLS